MSSLNKGSGSEKDGFPKIQKEVTNRICGGTYERRGSFDSDRDMPFRALGVLGDMATKRKGGNKK